MNKEEFESRIFDVDNELRKQGLNVAQRAYKAFDKLSPNSSFIFRAPLERERFPEAEYSGQALDEKIQDWYMRYYGERAQWIITFDKIPIILLDDIYFFRIPRCYGHGPHQVNLLEIIEGFTPSTGELLDENEINRAVTMFQEGYRLSLILENLFKSFRHANSSARIGNDPFLASAIRDREIAARSLTLPYDFNNSIFHSQQFAEKMLKSLLFTAEKIEKDDIGKTYGHRMRELWNRAKVGRENYEEIESSINVVSQVKMEIRYSLEERTINDAVAIFWDALRIAAFCGKSLDYF